MFLSLMYHHINSDKYSNSLELIEKHFQYISTHYKTIFPEEYQKNIFNIELCLVFDDAYYDFYYYVFPLLKKYNLKALLAIPVRYIINSTDLEANVRLSLSHSKMMENNNYKKYVPFCTWKELQEMNDSGYVQIVSHSYNHVKLDLIDLQSLKYELEESKVTIENKLNSKCNSFVYPYGNFNKQILDYVNNYYQYNFAIGGCIHYDIINKPIYRVPADDMINYYHLFTIKNRIKYMLRGLRKRMKGIK